MENKNTRLIKLLQTGILAALCFVSFTFLSIKIPVAGGDAVSLHVGNAFCVLAALLLGGLYGGLSGAIGMTISDLLDPTYAIGAPKTFILKLCIGLITGLIAHNFAKIDQSNDKKYIARWTIIAAIGGLSFNVVFDPIVGYFYKQYILGQPQQMAAILAKFSVFATFINAIVSVILVSTIYNVIRPVLKTSGLLFPVAKNKSIN
ncbi:ECF transporter S component [Clostridium sp. YIM B02555]|uniref:ECF transporter S component n=1 Tax=Clostridium sp. YIM B02555 TaxID=2911968 RepID=UPI001EEEC9F5|nr:ECF transporter S component [Clostridium sp. YIM B02555]